MNLIKIGTQIINLDNVAYIDLIDNGVRVDFNYMDGDEPSFARFIDTESANALRRWLGIVSIDVVEQYRNAQEDR
jgi:hypothetical protein